MKTAKPAGTIPVVFFALMMLFAATSHCVLLDASCDSSDASCSGAVAAGLLTQFEPAPIAGTPTPNALPVDGVDIWFAAAYGLTESGGEIVDWADQSGNGFDLFAVGVGPILKTSAINAQPVLAFDGVSSNFSMGDKYPFSDASNSGMSIFVVCRSEQTDNLNSHFLIDFGFHAGDNYSLRYSADSGGSNEGGMGTPTSSGGTNTAFDVTTTTADFVILSFRVEFGVEQRVHINGTSAASAPITLTALDSTTIREQPTRAASLGGPFSVGMQSKAIQTGRTFQGDIAEIILYFSALTDGDRRAVECYLSDKYAISVSQTCS